MKQFISNIIKFTFTIFFISLLFFFFLEFYKTGFVTNYVNFNLLLIITLIFGTVSVLLPAEFERKHTAIHTYVLALALAVVAGIFIDTVLPETYRVYQIAPWIIGIGVLVGISMI